MDIYHIPVVILVCGLQVWLLPWRHTCTHTRTHIQCSTISRCQLQSATLSHQMLLKSRNILFCIRKEKALENVSFYRKGSDHYLDLNDTQAGPMIHPLLPCGLEKIVWLISGWDCFPFAQSSPTCGISHICVHSAFAGFLDNFPTLVSITWAHVNKKCTTVHAGPLWELLKLKPEDERWDSRSHVSSWLRLTLLCCSCEGKRKCLSKRKPVRCC